MDRFVQYYLKKEKVESIAGNKLSTKCKHCYKTQNTHLYGLRNKNLAETESLRKSSNQTELKYS